MFNPPITGNKELDSYLYDISLNINDAVATAEETPDIPAGDPATYLYQYIQVKYATDNVGTGFSNVPTNKTYFGLYNSSSSTESTNPANYTWYLSSIPFGTTYFLYYLALGGRKIKFAVNNALPDYKWKQDNGNAIDIDIIVPSNTVSATEVLDNAITELKIAANAVTASKINVAAIDQAFGDLRPNTVSAAQIANNAVTELKILDSAITNGKLNSGAVTSDKIYANTITAGNIAALTIGADQIAANAITAVKIDTGAVTAGKIFAGAVTADKITVSTLAAINANLGTITTGQITNTSYNTTMKLGSAAGGSSSGATMYFERTGSASSALGPIIYGNDTSTSKTAYSYAFASNVADTFLVYTDGNGLGSYNGIFQAANGSGTCFNNLAVLGYTDGPGLSVSQYQYNGTAGSPVNPAGDFSALNSGAGVAARIKLASGTGYAYYIVTGVGGPFTGAHDGLISKTETIEQGDIVVDGTLVRKSTLSDTIYTVTKSTTPNQPALGVFNSSAPMAELSPPTSLVDGYTIKINPLGEKDYIPNPAPEFYEYEPTHDSAIINSIGEGQINVCGENGNISAGDLIVTSSIAGKGMKQSDDLIRSYTVAKAREAATFTNQNETKMIACIYVSG